MSFLDQLEAGSLGVKPMTVDYQIHLVNTAEATAALVKGAVVQLDTTRLSAETTSSRPGVSGSIWANAVTPVVTAATYRIGTEFYVVALEAIAKGAEGKARMTGYAQALVLNTHAGTTFAAGNFCTPTNAKHYLEADSATPTQVDGAKFVFMLDETSATSDNGTTLRKGWFDGNSWGSRRDPSSLAQGTAATLTTLTDSTGGSGTHDDTLADGLTVGAAFTDNTTGSAGDTLAAGVGIETLTFSLALAELADGDIVTAHTIGYKFKILSVDFFVEKAVTTGAKLSTLNIEIGTTNITGGAVALTSADCTPKGAKVAGSAVTALNTGSNSDTISVEAASTTTFVEGTGWLVIRIQNMDTADAFASISAKVNELRTDATVQNQNDSDIAQKVIEIVSGQKTAGLMST